MSKVGYARVSTRDQHPEAQRERLIAAGCDPELIFTDHGVSGSRASRPEWDKCVAQLRRGDVLVSVRLDRIGRSVRNLLDIVQDMDNRGVDLVFLDQGIDTSTAMGKMLFTILGAVAEYERNLIVDRTKDGLASTTARGRSGGRRHRLTPDQQQQAARLRADGHSIRDIGILLGTPDKPVSRQTVYRALGNIGPDKRRTQPAGNDEQD